MGGKLNIAFIGCGDFARNFVPLFKLHPLVEKVYVCDLLAQRAEEYSKKFEVETVANFDEVLNRRDINCVAIFAQRHLHGPLVLKALSAGKHVYSAVPMASEVEECAEIVEKVKETGLTYMMGETCYYYPCSMYCRCKHEEGFFGKFVYGEAQYHHDISHFPANFLADKRSAGVPPFFYPTHSTAMLLAAANSYCTRVVAFGYEDQEADGIYEKGVNQWDNVFSNSYSLMKLANGGTARINECRRIGYKAPSSYVSSFYGTKGAYQFSNAQHILTRLTEKGVDLQDVSDDVNPYEMTKHKCEPDFKLKVANHQWQWNGFSPVQKREYDRLPESFKRQGAVNGHMASHQLLVDDFCTAAFFGKLPIVNAWQAARWTIPGLLAHQSTLKDGEAIAVPDCGDPPSER
ncbi:MAG: Gfo/Idh/MocA family oxidoreductase [Lentisphaeria bacterium]|nr:Gfo/Idh/MocA family oxidoreductase [Lentisphaeria bacterium]